MRSLELTLALKRRQLGPRQRETKLERGAGMIVDQRNHSHVRRQGHANRLTDLLLRVAMISCAQGRS
jgi:hypothetical protein